MGIDQLVVFQLMTSQTATISRLCFQSQGVAGLNGYQLLKWRALFAHKKARCPHVAVVCVTVSKGQRRVNPPLR